MLCYSFWLCRIDPHFWWYEEDYGNLPRITENYIYQSLKKNANRISVWKDKLYINCNKKQVIKYRYVIFGFLAFGEFIESKEADSPRLAL